MVYIHSKQTVFTVYLETINIDPQLNYMGLEGYLKRRRTGREGPASYKNF